MSASPGYAARAAFTLRGPARPGLVVALHGLTGARGQPLALLEGVVPAAFGVLAPDLRAHGDTPLVGPAASFTAAQLAIDVESLLVAQDLAARRVVVLGVSLGATVALELLRRRVLDVAGAVFVRPAHAAGPPRHLAVNERIASLLRADPATALDHLLASDAYADIAAISPMAAAGLRRKVTGSGSLERVMRLEAGSRWTAFTADERIEKPVPCLVIGAPRDPLHPLPVAQAWHERIAGSAIVVLPPRDEDAARTAAATRLAIGAFLRARAAELEPIG